MQVIAVGGWHGTDITREAIYTILHHNNILVKRLGHTPQVDWDIPLTILGVKRTPTNPSGWIHVIASVIKNVLSTKRNNAILVIQLDTHDAGIMRYWMRLVSPERVCIVNSHAGTLHLELLLVDSVKSDGKIILFADNIRTRSLAQGKYEKVSFFGTHDADLSYLMKNHHMVFTYNDTSCVLQKTFHEDIYPFLAAGVMVGLTYGIALEKAVAALEGFVLPSEKMEHLASYMND